MPAGSASEPLEESSLPEFTAKAVVAGVVLGLVFGAANAYLGLRVGLTEGTACAEVLRATAADASGSVWIFRGMAVGAAVKLIVGLFVLVPNEVGTALPFLPKAEIAVELAPARRFSRSERARRGQPAPETDAGVLAASGLVAGEGLAGVLVAALVALGAASKGRPPLVGGLTGEVLTAGLLLLVCAFLVRAGRRR